MKLNVEFEAQEQLTLLTFENGEFNNPRDFAVALSVIRTFCADYDLDPELDQEDLEAIIAKANESEKETFTFEIAEDGIEVSF